MYRRSKKAAIATMALGILTAISTLSPVPATAQSSAVNVSPMDLSKTQSALNTLGYDAGPADGIMGRRTSAAIASFQAYSNLYVTGALDGATIMALNNAAGSNIAMSAGSRPPQAPPAAGGFGISNASGSCQDDMARLEADMASMSAQGGSISICEAHRRNYEVLSRAAGILRQCPSADPTGEQAREFDRVANESLAALNGPCS